MNFTEAADGAAVILDTIGIVIVFLGSLIALAAYFIRWLKKTDRASAYQQARQEIGRSILLGLEFLVAGDIIRTVATSPSFQNLGVLGLLVIIRTFLSMALQVEVEGRWPWK